MSCGVEESPMGQASLMFRRSGECAGRIGRSARFARAAGAVMTIALALALDAHGAQVTFPLEVISKPVSIGTGLTYNASTFNGTVPGPVLKAKEGDEVTV